MSTRLTLCARIEAKPDQLELVKAELLKLIEPTLREPGCLQYDLHQDNEDPAVFMFFENWETHAHWQEHMKSPHLAEYQKAVEGAVASWTVNQLTQL